MPGDRVVLPASHASICSQALVVDGLHLLSLDELIQFVVNNYRWLSCYEVAIQKGIGLHFS